MRRVCCLLAGLSFYGFFCPPVKAQSSVVINEIHYNPDVKTEAVEFIELYNAGTNIVDLSGWYFSAGISYTFPAGTTMAPGTYKVVALNPASLVTKFAYTGALGPYVGGLSKEGEKITLRNAADGLEDEVNYQLGFPWPTVGDAPGYSVELIHPALDNDLSGSWRASVAGSASQQTNTLIADHSTWKYFKGTSEASTPRTAWRQLNFDDAAWLSATTPMGYGEAFLATPLTDMSSNYLSVFLRKTFVVTDPVSVSSLLLEAQYDDGFKVWINGVNVLNPNMAAGEVPFDGTAGVAREDLTYNLFTLNSPTYLVPGTNIIAVQAHNTCLSPCSSDFFIDVRLRLQTGPSGRGPTPGRLNSVYATNAPPQIRQVEHAPEQPAAGQPVKITTKVTDPDGVAGVVLQYQTVDPGNYIELADAAYANNWTSAPMNDAGSGGDELAGDDVYTAVLPASVQTHRRLVRYRITVTDVGGRSVRVPYADDPQPNFAYFCYNGVPTWRGAWQPGTSQAVTFPTNVMGRLPAIHLIGKSNTVATATWFSRYGGDAYQWGGALVYDGKVYDHIHYRARGGVWRYSMVKNMWKFDLNRGHEFDVRDNWGNKLKTKWAKLNLGASIQQGDFDHRGEQGMFESVGFRMFNLAGVEAPKTAFVTFRVVDDALEADPNSQFEGDFWGVYLALEQEGGRFLDEHDLPDGNFYKMEGGTGELNNLGPAGPADKSDLNYFLSNYSSKPETWWRTNLNVAKYVSYQAVVQSIHHYDICADKNFFYYRNPTNRLWEVHSWDLDLTWADNMYDSGCGGKDRIYQRMFDETNPSKPGILMEWRNRMREVRDLLWNNDQAYKLIDEYAALLQGPTNAPTLLDADRYLWDYNPKMLSSTYTPNLGKAGQGRFYQFPRESATNSALRGSFAAGVQLMKFYVDRRAAVVDALALDNSKPNRPTMTYTGPTNYPLNRLTFRAANYSGANAFASMKWRIGEISDPVAPAFRPDEPRTYEIETVWESSPITPFTPDITLPPTAVKVGHRYRTRVQMKDATGRTSNWSLPVEFTVGEPSNFSELLSFLRITEVMYNPPAGNEFEFIELHNNSQNALDLTGVKFTQGIDYTFTGGTVIPPGGYLLVVRATNVVAFRQYYGLDDSVAIVGLYIGTLDNGGERVTLRTGSGGTDIVSFTYGDGAGWPQAADGAGHSLVLLDEAEGSEADGAAEYGGNWRASTYAKGSPGRADTLPTDVIVLNEIVAHTDYFDPQRPEYDSNDWIELFNRAGTNVVLGPGWYLSDSAVDLAKWMIPPGTVIPARGWVTFDEVSGFHSPTNIGFGLNKAGEQVFLSCLPGTAEDRVVDSVGFKGQENGWSLGRYPDGANGWFALTPVTRDTTNAPPPTQLVINELMYHPPDVVGTNATNENVLDEFIELHNPMPNPVELFNTNGTWRLDGAVSYSFPPSLVLPANGYLLVVNFDPLNTAQLAAFRAAYDATNSGVMIVGPYGGGSLPNSSARVGLEKPQAPDFPGEPVNWVVVDEVIYADQAPWPCGSDGTGASLQRQDPAGYGNNPLAWVVAGPTAGRENVLQAAGAPAIVAQPLSRTVATNSAVTFNVSVCGTPPFTYQWRFNGADISGATNATLSLNNVQSGDAGAYSVVVSNGAGSAASEPAILIVQLPPLIVAHPQSRAVIAYTATTFDVTAQGTPPLSYQWRLDGANLFGATNATLVLTNIQPAQAGNYSVQVFNAAGSVVSSNATLVVNVPPAIMQQPQGQTVGPGANVILSVAATGTSPLSYQWRFNGMNIAGATNAPLTLVGAQLTNSGPYLVVVTNAFGSATSQVANVTVLVGPRFAQQPLSLIVTQGATATFSVVSDPATLPMGFRWRRNGTTATFFKMDQNSNTFTLTNVQAANAARYDVILTNAANPGGILSSSAYLTLVLPPTNQSVLVGTDVTLRAILVLPPATLGASNQWQFNGSDLAPGTSTNQISIYPTNIFWTNDLKLTNVAAAQSGQYRIVVTTFSTNSSVTNFAGTNLAAGPRNFEAVLTVGDSDGDGMPDDWELANGLNPNDPNDAALDSDGDGLTNQEEYIAGTHPHDAASVLEVESVGANALVNGRMTFTFDAMAGRSYTVEYRDVLYAGSWVPFVNFDVQPGNRMVTVTNSLPAGTSQRFYRVLTPRLP